MWLKTLILSTLFSASAFALDLRTQIDQKKNNIAVLGISSSFRTSDGSISGTGLAVDFSHGFSNKISLDVSVSTALSQGKGVSSSFTGLGGYIYYSLLADCCDKYKTGSLGGIPIFEETLQSPYLLQLGIGINQYFLNGSKGVYSSSGLGLGGNFLFRIWDYRVKLTAKMSQMTSNDTAVQGLFFGAGLVFPL